MDNAHEVVRSYGLAFDNTVDLVADAMAAFGYQSKHSSKLSTEAPSMASLRDAIIGMSLLCANMETDLLGPLQQGRDKLPGKGFLSIYAAAKRLVLLFRYAQSAGSIGSRAAFEVDGDIDTLEELVIRPTDPAALIDASHSIVHTSLRFQDGLPPPLVEQIVELRNLLDN